MTSLPLPRTRSWLFTPATRPDRFAKAQASGADVVILDLEDAVAPADKAHARTTALAHLAAAAATPVPWALRINALATPAGIADLAALLAAAAAPAFLVLPKVEAAATLAMVDSVLIAAGKPTRLVALIESAPGLAAVEAMARATPRLAALMFGAADMAADLGAACRWAPLAHARGRIVTAAALGGVTAIDAPYFAVADAAGLAAEVAAAAELGYTAKAAIHPGQLAVINAAFTPGAEAIAEARAIVAAAAKGIGIYGGRMIDEAMARQARRVLVAAGVDA